MNLKTLLKEIKTTSEIPSIEINGINYDSRKIKAGDLFVAIKGMTIDGHNYLKEIASRGAVAAVVEKPNKNLSIPQISIENSRETLSKLANTWFGYPSKKMTVVGVTGTNGKTTTTYILESIAKQSGKNPGVIGTINYRFGGKTYPATHTTPESLDLQELLLNMHSAGVDFVILEVSSHALELKRVLGIDFDVAIFTNLTQDHLDFHKNLDHYFESKSLFFTTIMQNSSKSKKYSVVNTDDPKGEILCKKSKIPVITFGVKKDKNRDIFLDTYKFSYTGLEGKFNGIISGMFQSHLIGIHNLYNILCASAASFAVGIAPEDIIKGIEKLKGVPGRLERVTVKKKSDPIVLVDYAHTDDALKNVLSCLQSLPRAGKLITVFGCGGDRDPSKRPLMGKAAMSSSDIVVVTSDNPRTEAPLNIISQILPGILETGAKENSRDNLRLESGFLVEADRRKAIQIAIELAKPEDIVLIAGKGHEDYQIIGKKKVHFDDREVALEALKKKEL